jgi:hypothetical protein
MNCFHIGKDIDNIDINKYKVNIKKITYRHQFNIEHYCYKVPSYDVMHFTFYLSQLTNKVISSELYEDSFYDTVKFRTVHFDINKYILISDKGIITSNIINIYKVKNSFIVETSNTLYIIRNSVKREIGLYQSN